MPVGNLESHKITVKSVTPDKVVLEINSSSLPVEIVPGHKVFIDLNRDGQDDIAITAGKVTGASTVKLDVQKLRLDARPVMSPAPKPEAFAGPLDAIIKKTSALKPLPKEEFPRTPIFMAVMIVLVATVTFVGLKLYKPKGKGK